MINIPFDSISPNHIKALVDNSVSESRSLDFKLELPGNSDGDKKEFLKDVSALGNTAGGDLIIGIEDNAGIATSITGVNCDDFDAEILRIESIIRDGLDPRLIGVRTQTVTCDGAKTVLMIRVPMSFGSPHMVSFKNASKFFARSSAGVYQLDAMELRNAFQLSGDLNSRIKNWRIDRVAKIVAGETPVSIHDSATMVLHIVPLDSFENDSRLSGQILNHMNVYNSFPPIGTRGWSHRLNLDGVATFGQHYSASEPQPNRSYCQVFRSGRIESVCSNLVNERPELGIASEWHEKKLLEAVAKYFNSLSTIDVGMPVVVMLTFFKVKGSFLAVPSGFGGDLHPFDREMLALPDILIEEAPTNLPRLLKPMFDAAWNACGVSRSLNYDEDGNWNAGHLTDVPQGEAE